MASCFERAESDSFTLSRMKANSAQSVAARSATIASLVGAWMTSSNCGVATVDLRFVEHDVPKPAHQHRAAEDHADGSDGAPDGRGMRDPSGLQGERQ